MSLASRIHFARAVESLRSPFKRAQPLPDSMSNGGKRAADGWPAATALVEQRRYKENAGGAVAHAGTRQVYSSAPRPT